MAIKLTISFKNNEKDKKLFEWITEHSNYSGFTKDILRKEMLKGRSLPEKNNKSNCLVDF